MDKKLVEGGATNKTGDTKPHPSSNHVYGYKYILFKIIIQINIRDSRNRL